MFNKNSTQNSVLICKSGINSFTQKSQPAGAEKKQSRRGSNKIDEVFQEPFIGEESGIQSNKKIIRDIPSCNFI